MARQPSNYNKEVVLDALEEVAQFGVPTPAAARLLDIGSREYLRFFESEIIDDLVQHRGSTCRFFEGPFGAGKTHLLRLLEALAHERSMAVCHIDLSHVLQLSDWRLITRHILQNIQARVDGQTVKSFPVIAAAITRSVSEIEFSRDVRSLPHLGLYRAVEQLVHRRHIDNDAQTALDRFLTGERVGAGYLRVRGIHGVKDPLSQRNAELFLKSMSGAMVKLGLTGTMLLFDEGEQMYRSAQSYPSKKLQQSANIMRRFVDACTDGSLVGTVAVFAVLPGFVTRCGEAYPALGQRLKPPTSLDLEPSWRWPVIGIEDVGKVVDEDEFLERLVVKLVGFLESGDADGKHLAKELQLAGEDVLRENAGLGFRRPMLKRLASITLAHI